ncbi:SPOR domain-containing protein [Phaeovulum sp.]|uniref:SPOR domain-containing protein n=1 Tax=Phaeovulum sp. TaxID=2934796 RepID=UPI0039E43928
MARQGFTGLVLVLGCGLLLAGCEEGGQPFGFLKGKTTAEGTEGSAAYSATRLVERDVEAPEVFSVSDQGLWDGRPSLGGVWVAHPAVKDPERVIIRNTTNGKFVIGALFRRERENPGPKTQVSSDAAAALGMLAGQPAALSVVALRRQDVAADPQTKGAPALPAPEKIETKPIDDLGTKTAAAPVAAGIKPRAKPAVRPKPPAAAAPANTPAASGQFYIQIGIFSVEANAKEAADQLSAAGISSSAKKETSQGKTFWRVLAGPMAETDRDAQMTTVKGLGYPDAYIVSN